MKPMEEPKLKVKIIEEKPVGYVIELIAKRTTMVVPKKTFVKRVERGVYDVMNLNKLMNSI